MVLVNPIFRGFAGVLADLEAALDSSYSGQSSAAGFGCYLHERFRLPFNFSFRIAQPAGDLNDAPALAQAGYYLRLVGTAASSELIDRWRNSLERLLVTDLFPLDRQSFVYRPMELLGITLGVLSTGAGWEALQKVLERLIATVEEDTAISLTIRYASRLLGFELRSGRADPVRFGDRELALFISLFNPSNNGIASDGELQEVIIARREFLDRALCRKFEERDFGFLAALRIALLLSCRTELRFALDTARQGKMTGEAIDLIKAIFLGFHRFAIRLRDRRSDRTAIEVKNEYDVQDLLGGLLAIHFSDLEQEVWTPLYAGNASRVDFWLRDHGILIEAKMLRASLPQRQLVDELIVDHQRYSKMTGCHSLLCFVYDPKNSLRNPKHVAKELELVTGNPQIQVFIYPEA
jgi:hypothetical protein